MRHGLVIGSASLLGLAVLTAGRAAAADPAGVGILDGLNVPSIPVDDGRPAGRPVQADPIPVPTPTAAQSGLVMLAGLVGWRATRRVIAGR